MVSSKCCRSRWLGGVVCSSDWVETMIQLNELFIYSLMKASGHADRADQGTALREVVLLIWLIYHHRVVLLGHRKTFSLYQKAVLTAKLEVAKTRAETSAREEREQRLIAETRAKAEQLGAKAAKIREQVAAGKKKGSDVAAHIANRSGNHALDLAEDKFRFPETSRSKRSFLTHDNTPCFPN
mgnify:CR=1 FL=1